jgi:ribosomal protein L11 methylase PrmA
MLLKNAVIIPIILSLSWTLSFAFTIVVGDQKLQHQRFAIINSEDENEDLCTKQSRRQCNGHQRHRFAIVNSENENDELCTTQSTRQHNDNIHRRDLLICGSVMLSSLIIEATAASAEDQISILDGEKQCSDGRIASESQVPGAYQQLCMGLEQRTVKLQSSGDTITIAQGTNSANGSSIAGRTGVAVWNSGILLTRLIDEINRNSSIFKDMTVMELGCGAGLASIALAKFGSSSVIATDANVEVLGLAKQNFDLNNVSSVSKTAELKWGLLDASEYDGIADIVVGSDLTYNSGSWLALAETMATVLKPDGFVLYLTLGHSGFNVQAELGGFLQVAENAGLRVLQEEQSVVGQKLADLLERITSKDEKQVISANGGARAVLLCKKTSKKFR